MGDSVEPDIAPVDHGSPESPFRVRFMAWHDPHVVALRQSMNECINLIMAHGEGSIVLNPVHRYYCARRLMNVVLGACSSSPFVLEFKKLLECRTKIIETADANVHSDLWQ